MSIYSIRFFDKRNLYFYDRHTRDVKISIVESTGSKLTFDVRCPLKSFVGIEPRPTFLRVFSPSADIAQCAHWWRIIHRRKADGLQVGAQLERPIDAQQCDVVTHDVRREFRMDDDFGDVAHLTTAGEGHAPAMSSDHSPLVRFRQAGNTETPRDHDRLAYALWPGGGG